MLLFHKSLVSKHKILLHYIPLFISCFYLPNLLIYLIFFFPCEQNFDYTTFGCGIPCFAISQPIRLINQILYIIVPLLIMLICNSFILIRVSTKRVRTLVNNNFFINISSMDSLYYNHPY